LRSLDTVIVGLLRVLCTVIIFYDGIVYLQFITCFTDRAGGNAQHQTAKNTAALDRETEELHHEKVTLTVSRAMQQGRQAKGMTQKELATVSIHPLVFTFLLLF